MWEGTKNRENIRSHNGNRVSRPESSGRPAMYRIEWRNQSGFPSCLRTGNKRKYNIMQIIGIIASPGGNESGILAMQEIPHWPDRNYS